MISFINILFLDGNITLRAICIKINAVSTPAFIFATLIYSITTAAWLASSSTQRTSCSFWFFKSTILSTESTSWILAVTREYTLKTFSQLLCNQVIKRKMHKYPLTCTNPYFNIFYFFFLIFWEWYFCLFVCFWSIAFQSVLFCILRFFAAGKITNVKDWVNIQNYLAILFQRIEASLNDWLKHPQIPLLQQGIYSIKYISTPLKFRVYSIFF